MVPLSFSFLEKKTNVLFGPIIAVMPHKNKTYTGNEYLKPNYFIAHNDLHFQWPLNLHQITS
jgi:hypothetical protein